MIRLAAFADEISPDLDEQIRVCRANDVAVVELRGVDGKNVMAFDDALCQSVRKRLADAGMCVGVIGSPVGKVALDQPWDKHFDLFKRAVELAEYFGAPMIRLFSYYPPGGEGAGPIAPHRDEVVRRFNAKVDYLQYRHITLVHENEKGIFGDTAARCLDLLKTVNSPKLRAAFDFANFVQVGERPIENWTLLKTYTTHIHIKDAKMGSGEVTPAGQGDGDVAEILADAHASGYDGYLSLEPHLKVAAHSHGETGPELFKTAADALKTILRARKIPFARV